MSTQVGRSKVGASRAMADHPPRVDLLALGGTIASISGDDPGVVPTLTGEALLELLPDASSVAKVHVVDRDTPPVPGPHLHLEDILDVARRVERCLAEGAAGCVVTQGTDTIEESAFALDVLLGDGPPVVMTGAMRDPTLPGADGAANLLGAIRVAASPAARDCGVLVVMADEIHAARYVRKVHPTRPAAFTSPLTGPIGTLTEDRATIRLRPERAPSPGLLDAVEHVPEVALVRATIGDDGRLLDHVEDCGYAGLVYEGFGGGHVLPTVADRLERLATAMPVVFTSRVGNGSLLRHTYGFVGSERDLAERGPILVDDIDGLKARVLLTFLLGAGEGRDGIVEAFANPVYPDDDD